MKVFVYIGHPAHVHLFKNMIWNLVDAGHKIKIVARSKDVTINLLAAYEFKYDVIGRHHKGLFNKVVDLIKADYRSYKIARDFEPDIIVSAGSISAAHVSKLIKKPSISLEDTEHSVEQYWLYAPFTDIICTPSCFKKDLGKKQVRYNGYHELAYLHPNYFKPNPSVLDGVGLSKDATFIILRFVSWGASHDIGQKGFDLNAKRRMVKELGNYGRVFITSEKPLPTEFEKYRISAPPEKLHDLLYYAHLCLSDGGTTASEAAILGTPSIHVATTAKYCGVFDDMHVKYGLIYTFDDEEQGLEKAISILENGGKKVWASRREKMLIDKIDVTAFMTWFVENYPESFKIMKENPEYQNRFRSRWFL